MAKKKVTTPERITSERITPERITPEIITPERITPEIVEYVEEMTAEEFFEGQENMAEILDETNISDGVTYLTEVQTLNHEITNFIASMAGKSRASYEEIKVMYDLYNRKYNKQETNYSCDVCAMRIYQKLVAENV